MNSSFLDTPAARKNLEQATRPFNIASLGILTLLSSALCIVGMFTGGLAWLHTGLPASTLKLMMGFGFFLICCPQFLLLSFCRTLLRAIRQLEKQVEELKR